MTRQRLSLDGPWEFFPDPERRLRRQALGGVSARTILVPGPWQAQYDDLRDYSGVAWYRTTFEFASSRFQVAGSTTRSADGDDQPATWNLQPSTMLVLHFGAVDYHASVWLNGHLLGEHEGGYLPFELDTTAALRPAGPNELIVRVVDPSDDAALFPDYPFAEIPHGKQSWYGPIGGIWQGVYLEARAATHIARVKVTPDVPGEQAHVVVTLNRPAAARLALSLRVADPQGDTATHAFTIDAGESAREITLPIPNPTLWDTRSPHLYHLEATLAQEASPPRTHWRPPSACGQSPPRPTAT